MLQQTVITFIRHAESPYVEGKERERGLSEKGSADALKIRDLLRDKPIDVLYSSPYERAIQTLRPLSIALRQDILIEEDFRERKLAGAEFLIAGRFEESKRVVYEDFDYSFLGGESSRLAQQRAVHVLDRILELHAGKYVAIGTHGDIMTLMMNHLDKTYDYEFWKNTSMPDIYELRLDGKNLIDVRRLWKEV